MKDTKIIKKPKADKIKIYIDPKTKQTPEITIDISNPEKYQDGINALRKILLVTRDFYTVIPFKVISTYGHNTPEFLMHCYDLYIIGYRTSDGNIRVFKDQGKNFPSLKYEDIYEKQEYNFKTITLEEEKSTKLKIHKIIESNLKILHAIGYTIAEAVRSYNIENYIKKLISSVSTNLNINKRIFELEDLGLDLKIFENIDLVTKINEALDKLTTYTVSHAWGISTDGEDSCLSKPKLEGLINQVATEIHKLIKENTDILLEVKDIFAAIKPSMESAIKCKPKPSNSTDIPQGLYKKSDSSPQYYSKIPGSEKFNYQFSTSDDSPDDNSGSGAIAISPKKNDDAKHSNIEWIEAIEQGDVKDYLLSLGIIQRIQEALAKMKNMLEKPTTIDFIIKRASEVATFSGCMLLSTPTKDLSTIENKITICSGFAALSGLTNYDNLQESGEILGQLIEIS